MSEEKKRVSVKDLAAMDDHHMPSTLLTSKQQLNLLLAGTVVIGIVAAAIGLMLYHKSGTAQLDLSRPGFEGVNEIVEKNSQGTSYVEYPANGAIDQSALDEFDKLYKTQLDNIKSVDAFNGDPLNPDALHIAPPEEQLTFPL